MCQADTSKQKFSYNFKEKKCVNALVLILMYVISSIMHNMQNKLLHKRLHVRAHKSELYA